MSTLHKVLVPLDGSAPSIAALDHAIALVREGDATLDVLHVETSDDFAVGSSSPLAPDLRIAQDKALEDAITHATSALGGRLTRRDIRGEPLRTIVETAADGHYDLIVIGTHGRGGRLRSVLGSVAEGVVRTAPCPVLTVREPSERYESFAERRHGRTAIGDIARH